MKWLGKKLKDVVEQRYGTQDEFCAKIGVSRQAYGAWVNSDKIPNGKSLMQIARELKMSVAAFFEDDACTNPQFMPMHNAQNSEEKTLAARELAEEYRGIIKPEIAPVFQPVCNLPTDDHMRLAMEFRRLSRVSENEPISYGNVFTLANSLEICIVFREFPEVLKDMYAFHCLINNISVIFVDTNARVTDLVFILLHEICHAVRRNDACSGEEDDFCDRVADAAQFPQIYLDEVQHGLNSVQNADEQLTFLIPKLKKFSLLGLYKSFERRGTPVNWQIGSKDKIKKINAYYQRMIPKMKAVLTPSDDPTPEKVCKNYQMFSTLFFMCFLLPQLENMTARFIAQIFDLPRGSDGEEILRVLRKMRGDTYDYCR